MATAVFAETLGKPLTFDTACPQKSTFYIMLHHRDLGTRKYSEISNVF
jgi:hypothetical protein